MAQSDPEKEMKAKKTPQPGKGGGFDVNNELEWAAMRRQWVKEQLEKAQAHADRVLATDEDLPLSRHILLFTIGLFFVIFFLWASFAQLDEVTRGTGKIIPSSEVQALQSLEGGIVDEFLVKEGEEVKAGQPLLRLRDVQASSDLGSNQAKYLGLLATVTRLQAEAEGKGTVEFPEDVVQGAPESVTEEMNAFKANQTKNEGQLRILNEQLMQRQQEVKELETKANDLRGVLGLAHDQRNMVAPLVERGSAPKMELLQLDRDIKEKQTDLNGATAAMPRASAAVKEAQARVDDFTSSFKAQAQTDLSAKLTEMNSIKETLSALKERKTRTEIKSPVDGIIKDLKVHTVGGVVKPGENIVEIVPKDDQLLVEASVRPSDIAFIYPGQPAMIKITAYDFSIYGGLKGEVVDISADAITNEKGESFYRVRLRTYENSLKRHGEVLPIIPGMVATADILTGHKTVMEYIMKPLIKTVDQAMHER